MEFGCVDQTVHHLERIHIRNDIFELKLYNEMLIEKYIRDIYLEGIDPLEKEDALTKIASLN